MAYWCASFGAFWLMKYSNVSARLEKGFLWFTETYKY